MKRLITLLAILSLAVTSCDKMEYGSYHRTAEELYEFGSDLEYGTIGSLIATMNEMEDEELFEDGFSKTIKGDFEFDSCDCTIYKADQDSTWIISSTSNRRDKFIWETTVRMLPDYMAISSGEETYKYHCWEVTTSGIYYEKSGYYATFSSSSIILTWGLLADNYSYYRIPTVEVGMNSYGVFCFETFIDNTKLDYGRITFDGEHTRFESSQGSF